MNPSQAMEPEVSFKVASRFRPEAASAERIADRLGSGHQKDQGR